jgi:hypothetical protein
MIQNPPEIKAKDAQSRSITPDLSHQQESLGQHIIIISTHIILLDYTSPPSLPATLKPRLLEDSRKSFQFIWIQPNSTMKLAATIFHLIACANVSLAFSPILQQGSRLTTLRSSSRTRVFSSQWDEDDDGAGVDQATSFEDAGEGLQNEDDNKRMDDMGDYDANPAVSFVLFR